MRTLIVAAFCLAFLSLGAPTVRDATQAATAELGVPAELPPVEALKLQHTTVFSAPAPLGYSSGTRCDSQGHVYLLPPTFAGVPLHLQPSSSISELIPDEKRIVMYKALPLPESSYPRVTRMLSFAVLPDGGLYTLIFTQRISSPGKPLSGPEYYIERFKADGTRDSITHIDTPPGLAHWYAELLAPFADGRFLISGTGTNTKERPGADSSRPFTAIYGPDGWFLRELTLSHDIAKNHKEGSDGKPGDAGGAKVQGSPTRVFKPGRFFDVGITPGDVVSGPYGDVWILRNGDPIRIYAVNSSGRVTEHFEFSPPVQGLAPFDFGFASPQEIFLEFARPLGTPGAPSPEPSELIGIFNTALQQFGALYRVSVKANRVFGSLACSDGNGGFLYLGSTRDNHLALFDYAPR